MMKNMILPIAFTALIASMTACSDETDPILTQKNWTVQPHTSNRVMSMASRCTISHRSAL